MILSNPPYIPLSEIETLDPSVKNYDPKDALTDYGDGMTFYKRINKLSTNLLNKNGFIALEFGSKNQIHEIINIFSDYRYEIFNDNTDAPRVIVLQK